MNYKIACFGVRPNERDYFEKLNTYNYELLLIEELLNHENIDLIKGSEVVMVRANCLVDKKNLEKMKEYKIKFLLTRTAGFNHIDLEKAKEFGIPVARVPFYSPNAVAELSLSLAMNLLRNLTYTLDRTSKYNFIIDSNMFSREIRNCKVGIIGVGRIGFTEAKLYKGLGAKVYGYSPRPLKDQMAVVDFVDLDVLLRKSDIVSLHLPYFLGENDNFVNSDFINKMKDGAILINTARGELLDEEAVLKGIESGKIMGFASDVFKNEKDFFFKDFKGNACEIKPTIKKLIDLYPKVLITPHIGSNTDEALINMIETSFENLREFEIYGKSKNQI